jgi:bacillithiol biosynthesis cysteine-adding enzyme BshC
MSISFDKFNNFSSLFKDYISNFSLVSGFYESDYRNDENFLESINRKHKLYLSGKSFTRNSIAEVLKIQNKFFNSSENTLKNIDLLKQDNTYAIVTGQQVGILSGNLYTIYKAVNAIQLSKKLNEKFPDYNFVPIFWMETDDNDFPEINNINLLTKENTFKTFSYYFNNQQEEKYLIPAGLLSFDSYINNFIGDIKNSLPKTDFTGDLFEIIARSYKPGISFAYAFARFLNYIIPDSGLIFCNPSDREIKNFLQPVFLKELSTYPKTCEIVIETSDILERMYEPQVKPKPINLFYCHNNNRYLIEQDSANHFKLKNTRKKFEKEELFQLLETNPENFSPNVVLRPICQDYLLPTVAYIGGPSEISYFAQFKNVYKYFNVIMPVIYPRTSVTILENKITSYLEKNNIEQSELFEGQSIRHKFINRISQTNFEDIFNKYIDEINALNYSLNKILEDTDKNLTNNFKNKTEKYIENVKFIKQKFYDSKMKQNDILIKKLDFIIEYVQPEKILQERYLNILYFINKYGLNFCSDLIDRIDINCFEHQIINKT